MAVCKKVCGGVGLVRCGVCGDDAGCGCRVVMTAGAVLYCEMKGCTVCVACLVLRLPQLMQ